MIRMPPAARVFWLAFQLGFKRNLADPLAFAGQFLTYGLIVITYAAVYEHIPPAFLQAHAITAADLTWYIAGTEIALFCFPSFTAKELQYELQTGIFESALLRPTPGWVVAIGRWMGMGLCTFSVLAIPAFVLTTLFAGSLPPDGWRAMGMAVAVLLSGLILSCGCFIVAASCLWLRQSEPVLWIFYKGAFLLGALIFPLSFYPGWLADFAWMTPFPAILATIGDWTSPHYGAAQMIHGMIHQIGWSAVFLLLVALTNRAILRHFQKGGA